MNINYQRDIDDQEEKDYFVASKVMKKQFEDVYGCTSFTTTKAQNGCNYDMTATFQYHGKTYNMAVEIKERNKDEEKQRKYPYSELKVHKYNLIMGSTKAFDVVYYCQLLNQNTAYLYNLRKLDFSKVIHTKWDGAIKKTQFAQNSKFELPPLFNIPYQLGTTILDINQYYKEFEEKNVTKSLF